MAEEYKKSHDKLVSALGLAADYHADWQSIARDLRRLATATGFDPLGHKVPAMIRAKLTTGASESAVLRAGAAAPTTDTGGKAKAGQGRVLALKTLRHLYYFQSFGKQRVWVLSLPKALRNYPMEFQGEAQDLVDDVLDADDEQFDADAKKNLSDATRVGLSWVHKAMQVMGAPMDHAHRQLIRRWFVPAGLADETAKIEKLASDMRPHLQKIAAGLKAGEVILTDSPHERGSGSSLEKSEAFVYPTGDLIAVHVETTFFNAGNTLSGLTNWARIVVHELTHSYAKTKDHSYSWQGLLPRATDVLKKGIDARLVQNPGWKAVRTLSFEQCCTNADSWAFFIADCGGALTDSDRMQALGQRIYDRAGEAMDDGLSKSLKLRAGVA